MRHQIDVAGDTIGDLQEALGHLIAAGATADTEVRVRTRATFNPDGAYARCVTARWQRPGGPDIGVLDTSRWGTTAPGPVLGDWGNAPGPRAA